jgi:uncharacterized MAPEG superfamily protein
MMTPELTVLALAGLVQAIQFAAFSITANLQVGPKVAMGPRDNVPTLKGTAGRLQRALNNHFEGLILFTLAVAGSRRASPQPAHGFILPRESFMSPPMFLVGCPGARPSGPWGSRQRC